MKNFAFIFLFTLIGLFSSAQTTPTPPGQPIPPPTSPTFPPSVDQGINRRDDSIQYRSQFPQDSTHFNRRPVPVPIDTMHRNINPDSGLIRDDRKPRNYPDTVPQNNPR